MRIIFTANRDARGAGLIVPAAEGREIHAAGFGETGEKLLDGGRISIMAAEVKLHARRKRCLADQQLEHADDLGPLFIDGCRVEVVDLAVGGWPHRMRQRAGILDELPRSQFPHIHDALHRTRAHVGGEFLVPKDGQSFLEAELEPVAASDPVTGPVVEILVGDDRLDQGVVRIGRCFGRGQNVLVVEDIEALVLHRAHVEIRDGDDVEHIEIIGAVEGFLVPAHGALQRIHGVARLALLALLDVDPERDLAAFGCREAVVDPAEIAADDGEEITGLGMRIVPDSVMAPCARNSSRFDRIAVAEQQRRFRAIGLDPRPVDGHHIRPVQKVADAPETIGLALRAIDAVRPVEPHQFGIGRRVDDRLDHQFKGPLRRVLQ